MTQQRPDIDAKDALRVAQRALTKVNDLEDTVAGLQAELEDAHEELTELSLRVSEFDEDRSYDDLTRNEKIGAVREHAFSRATETNGRAALDYNDVMWGVFECEPGAAHCYDLMQWAADAAGFDVRDRDGEPKQLVVDAAAAKDDVAFFSENKTAAEGGR